MAVPVWPKCSALDVSAEWLARSWPSSTTMTRLLGTVPLRPGDYRGANISAGIAISPPGKHLFVSIRRHDSVSTIARNSSCAA
ncbi:beta-propeller fold lactonase family protein [Pandoraea sputorum]|uniref:beta-propeller fold lactonase family protein n=1 Tax=Pandoraea sputorum TaxID=93222 RepID=UPI00398A9188